MRKIFCLLAITVAATLNTAAQLQLSPADRLKFDAAAAYSRSHRGVAMVVVKGDSVVFEDYSGIGSRELPWVLASGTKSFVGVICAAAIEDKLIRSFDEKVSDTITEWRGDPLRSKVTVRQLLSLTSGIDPGPVASSPSYENAIQSKALHDPGAEFEYGPAPFQVFGALLARKLRPSKTTVRGYIEKRILNPIGLKVSYWRESPKGEPLLPHGAALTAIEWTKFGRLVRDRGKFGGKQLIAAKLIDELTIGTKANPAYGITFWLNEKGKSPSGDERSSIAGDIGSKKLLESLDIFMAAGAGNQRLYVLRGLDLVVVRFGAFGGFDDSEFIARLVGSRSSDPPS